MKVLQINSVCGIRSTGRICTDLAEILVKNGHECKIAYGRESIPDQYKHYAITIGSPLGVKLHGMKARIFDAAGFGSIKETKKFIEWVKEYNPDVIHLHVIHGYYINIEILFNYLRTCGKKIVWTFHDCWAFTGHCPHFSVEECNKWETHCGHCKQKREYPSSVIFDRSFENFDIKKNLFTGIPNLIIITPSNWLADLVRRSYLKEYPVKVINNGIDLNIFRPSVSQIREEYKFGNKKIILGVAAVWNARKGLEDFVELSKKLSKRYQIVLIGLKRRQINKLPRNIIGLPKTDNIKKLAEWYSASDVFVNTTYEDTFPTVNLEAQACGTPVITYQTGGSPESVAEFNVVDQGDISALISKIKCICGNEAKKESYISSDIDKKYSRGVASERYYAIYVGNERVTV